MPFIHVKLFFRPATISNPEEQNVFSTINDTFDKPFESNYLNKLFNESKLSPSTIRSIKEELAKKHQIKNTDSLTTWQQQSEIAINQGTDKQQTKVITSPEKELVRWGHTETESVSATQEHSGTKTQAAAEDKLQESDNIKEMTKKVSFMLYFTRRFVDCNTARTLCHHTSRGTRSVRTTVSLKSYTYFLKEAAYKKLNPQIAKKLRNNK